MSENPENQGGKPAGTHQEEFELLSAAPTAADISGQLKPRSGGGLPKVTLALIGVVLAVGGFVGGIAVGKSSASDKSTSTNNAASGTNRTRGGFGGAGGTVGGANGQNGQFGRAGTVTGTVTAVNGTTITITDATGKTVTVDTNAQTTVTIGKTGAVSDLATGSQVTVIGTPGASGSNTITARSVLSGISNFGFPGGRGNRTPAPSASSSGGSNG